VNDTTDRPGVSAASGRDAQAAASPDTPAGRRCTVQSPMAAGCRRGGPPPGLGPVIRTVFAPCLIGGCGQPWVASSEETAA
jgi:hypothetical protein